MAELRGVNKNGSDPKHFRNWDDPPKWRRKYGCFFFCMGGECVWKNGWSVLEFFFSKTFSVPRFLIRGFLGKIQNRRSVVFVTPGSPPGSEGGSDTNLSPELKKS